MTLDGKGYYSVLGLGPGAREEEIKKSYKKLAMKHHPDKGGNKDQFQKIQEAYSVLGDPQKKKEYDNPVQFNDFPFFQHFHHTHAQQSQQTNRKNDTTYNMEISLDEAYKGCIKKIKVCREKMCTECKMFCTLCNGNGNVIKHITMGMLSQIIQQTCQNCEGHGIVQKKKGLNCQNCNNTGKFHETQLFEIKTPRGAPQLKQHVFEGWGEQGVKKCDISGNLVVNVNIKPHSFFKRNGDDLHYNVNISFKESVIGKTITIQHFAEDIVINTRGFGIINPILQYSVYGKGMITENGKCGNLFLTFSIAYPTPSLTEEQYKLLNDTFDKINI